MQNYNEQEMPEMSMTHITWQHCKSNAVWFVKPHLHVLCVNDYATVRIKSWLLVFLNSNKTYPIAVTGSIKFKGIWISLKLDFGLKSQKVCKIISKEYNKNRLLLNASFH